MKCVVVFLSLTWAGCNSLPSGYIQSYTNNFSKTDDFPNSGRTTAILESKYQETLPIKLDDKYGQVQGLAANIFKPSPLVDTISEGEKYGNAGEPFRSLSEKVVGGVEVASNTLNAVVELPFQGFNKVQGAVTSSLNRLGGKLTGLNYY